MNLLDFSFETVLKCKKNWFVNYGYCSFWSACYFIVKLNWVSSNIALEFTPEERPPMAITPLPVADVTIGWLYDFKGSPEI